ncbi:hypothetical protein OCK74_12650 [Chitinophagaceae bacterium LB-8]|uniref:Uncharacterized protein n=1 Tax=Paraflavisolibacter caeni TaxID=2982496 RepID=A0A9X2XP56_9BACT|nr:hypothetical protein [Paraflavisolibacter caeni]MCU7549974.1 hypothetical protein [Paraflavisolibacter caeni]
MGLFNFCKKRKTVVHEPSVPKPPVDEQNWTGKDFEFLITGVTDISPDVYDNIMTPNSLTWSKILCDEWPYYQVGEDEYSYSWELPGIQMTFSDDFPYDKAKAVADEVISNLRAAGQDAELIILDKQQLYHFE